MIRVLWQRRYLNYLVEKACQEQTNKCSQLPRRESQQNNGARTRSIIKILTNYYKNDKKMSRA